MNETVLLPGACGSSAARERTAAQRRALSKIRSRALAVVAKLSIFAGASGCGGTVVLDSDSDDLPSDEAPVEAAPGDAYPAEPPEVPIDSPLLECEGQTANAKCCGEVLTSAFTDPTLFNNPTLATSQQKGCCELVVSIMDAWEGAEPLPFDSTLGQACCSTELVENAWEDHPSCTPWGPPMPPPMAQNRHAKKRSNSPKRARRLERHPRVVSHLRTVLT